MNRIFVTGATGFIGLHTIVELLNAGYEVIALDNLCNSSPLSLARVTQITGKNITFIKGDIRDSSKLDQIFTDYEIDAVIHFAGLKAVGESVKEPLKYYNNNVCGSVKLLESMERHNIKTIIFSSSATVYGESKELPLREDMPTGIPTNPYGLSKLMVENILADLYKKDSDWNIARLRYFNPIGAHSSGLLGEDPRGVPNNLMPAILKAATGKIKSVNVYGDDYPTKDGSGVRDYVHVVDLALGHLAALKKCLTGSGLLTINLGTGQGYSVLHLIEVFEKACGVKIPYEITERRDGDLAEVYSDASYANELLDWKAKFDLDEMCLDSFRWAVENPKGYES